MRSPAASAPTASWHLLASSVVAIVVMPISAATALSEAAAAVGLTPPPTSLLLDFRSNPAPHTDVFSDFDDGSVLHRRYLQLQFDALIADMDTRVDSNAHHLTVIALSRGANVTAMDDDDNLAFSFDEEELASERAMHSVLVGDKPLPPGSGFAVGPSYGLPWLVLEVHFTAQSPPNGRDSSSALLRFVTPNAGARRVQLVQMYANTDVNLLASRDTHGDASWAQSTWTYQCEAASILYMVAHAHSPSTELLARISERAPSLGPTSADAHGWTSFSGQRLSIMGGRPRMARSPDEAATLRNGSLIEFSCHGGHNSDDATGSHGQGDMCELWLYVELHGSRPTITRDCLVLDAPPSLPSQGRVAPQPLPLVPHPPPPPPAPPAQLLILKRTISSSNGTADFEWFLRFFGTADPLFATSSAVRVGCLTRFLGRTLPDHHGFHFPQSHVSHDVAFGRSLADVQAEQRRALGTMSSYSSLMDYASAFWVPDMGPHDAAWAAANTPNLRRRYESVEDVNSSTITVYVAIVYSPASAHVFELHAPLCTGCDLDRFQPFGARECANSHRLPRPVSWYSTRWREAAALDSAGMLLNGLPAPLVVQYKVGVVRLESVGEYLQGVLPETGLLNRTQTFHDDGCSWARVSVGTGPFGVDTVQRRYESHLIDLVFVENAAAAPDGALHSFQAWSAELHRNSLGSGHGFNRMLDHHIMLAQSDSSTMYATVKSVPLDTYAKRHEQLRAKHGYGFHAFSSSERDACPQAAPLFSGASDDAGFGVSMYSSGIEGTLGFELWSDHLDGSYFVPSMLVQWPICSPRYDCSRERAPDTCSSPSVSRLARRLQLVVADPPTHLARLEMGCPRGSTIGIHFASFGRPLGDCTSGWSMTPCAARGALEAVRRQCDGREQCMVWADTRVFEHIADEDCDGELRWLSVEYTCDQLFVQPATVVAIAFVLVALISVAAQIVRRRSRRLSAHQALGGVQLPSLRDSDAKEEEQEEDDFSQDASNSSFMERRHVYVCKRFVDILIGVVLGAAAVAIVYPRVVPNATKVSGDEHMQAFEMLRLRSSATASASQRLGQDQSSPPPSNGCGLQEIDYFILAKGSGDDSTGDNADAWHVYRTDPEPTGISLRNVGDAANHAAADWFDPNSWWLQEAGLLLVPPEPLMLSGSNRDPVAQGEAATQVYRVRAMDESTGTLTVHADGRWELSHNTLEGVTDSNGLLSHYSPADIASTCTPSSLQWDRFPLLPGEPLPSVPGCMKADYRILVVTGADERPCTAGINTEPRSTHGHVEQAPIVTYDLASYEGNAIRYDALDIVAASYEATPPEGWLPPPPPMCHPIDEVSLQRPIVPRPQYLPLLCPWCLKPYTELGDFVTTEVSKWHSLLSLLGITVEHVPLGFPVAGFLCVCVCPVFGDVLQAVDALTHYDDCLYMPNQLQRCYAEGRKVPSNRTVLTDAQYACLVRNATYADQATPDL